MKQKHNNISIFIPHLGCPHKCSFCNQNSITGKSGEPKSQDIINQCMEAFSRIEDKENTEIAFFGGSFTAVRREYMLELLECVQEFIGKGKFKGIRISTRPDAINTEILDILKKYNVTSIELGVQSMNDEVLFYNDRGHTASDVVNAVELIKKYPFELGLQMMVGLYKSTPEKDIETAKKIISLNPDTVRIYPVVIMENTRLGTLFKSGKYIPYTLEEGVLISAKLIEMFSETNIRIIKLGLHASEIVEAGLLGGLYHPAFRELCDNRIFYEKIKSYIDKSNSKKFVVYVSDKSLSKAVGQNKCNVKAFAQMGINIHFLPCDNLNGYDVKIIEEETSCT